MQNRDQLYLEKLRDYYARCKVLPSFSEIAKIVGLKTTSSVSGLVGRLKQAGFIESGDGRRLRPTKRFFERMSADTVQAGVPAPANDVLPSYLNIDEYLIDTPSRTMILTVKGESMVGAGILSGDSVVVKKGAPAGPGDIVVAVVDGEFTVKYLAKDERGYFLKPANGAFQDIRARESLDLVGTVVGLIRKYSN